MGQEKSVPIRCNTCHNFSSSIKSPGSLSTSTVNLQSESNPNSHKITLSPSIRSPSRNTNKSTKSSQSVKTTIHSSQTRLSRHSTATTTSSTSSSSSYKSTENQIQFLNPQSHIKIFIRHCRRRPYNYFTFPAAP